MCSEALALAQRGLIISRTRKPDFNKQRFYCRCRSAAFSLPTRPAPAAAAGRFCAVAVRRVPSPARADFNSHGEPREDREHERADSFVLWVFSGGRFEVIRAGINSRGELDERRNTGGPVSFGLRPRGVGELPILRCSQVVFRDRAAG